MPLILSWVFSRGGMLTVAFAILVAACGVQTLRLDHAKGDLAQARAALIDPATKMRWDVEAKAAVQNLATCKGNLTAMQGAVVDQNAALEAVKTRDAQRDAQIAQALKAAQKSAAAAQSAGDQLATYRAKGSDVCARLLDADAKVKAEMNR